MLLTPQILFDSRFDVLWSNVNSFVINIISQLSILYSLSIE